MVPIGAGGPPHPRSRHGSATALQETRRWDTVGELVTHVQQRPSKAGLGPQESRRLRGKGVAGRHGGERNVQRVSSGPLPAWTPPLAPQEWMDKPQAPQNGLCLARGLGAHGRTASWQRWWAVRDQDMRPGWTMCKEMLGPGPASRGSREDWVGPLGLSPDTREQGCWPLRGRSKLGVGSLGEERERGGSPAFQSGCRGHQGTLGRHGRGGEWGTAGLTALALELRGIACLKFKFVDSQCWGEGTREMTK